MALNNNPRLGKGLKALLPVSFEDDVAEEEQINANGNKSTTPYLLCPIDFIATNPYQPRKEMDETALEQLSASIKEKGILQPLLVRKIETNKYELIAGERRLQAAKRAGLEKVPVITRDIAMSDRLELALIENIQRENLNPVEEAEAYAKLIEEFGMTQDSVAKRVGKNRSTIANSVRILQLPADIRTDLAKGLISSGHARVLLSLDSEEEMRMFRDEIINKKLSVRETEVLIKKYKKRQLTPNQRKEVQHAMSDSYCTSLNNSIVNYLGSKAKIIQNGQRGKIEIEYYSPDDLERVLSLIVKQ